MTAKHCNTISKFEKELLDVHKVFCSLCLIQRFVIGRVVICSREVLSVHPKLAREPLGRVLVPVEANLKGWTRDAFEEGVQVGVVAVV